MSALPVPARPLAIAHLTAGTGGFHCGTCIRDNALVRALVRAGHDATLVPLYLPIVADGTLCDADAPILFSGINVYLQHVSPLFRALPRWMDAILAARPLLRLVGRGAGSTLPEEVGDLTVSMLRGEDGPQRKEVERLVDALRGRRLDAIILSNSLLVGLARPLRERLGVPVICTVQGEVHFVDAMGPRWGAEIWPLLRAGLDGCDGIVAVSGFAADVMAARTGLPRDRFEVVWNGVDVEGTWLRTEPATPTLGFLARLIPTKGLDVAVDVYQRARERVPGLKLLLVGTQHPADRPHLARAVERVGRSEDVEVHVNVDLVTKRALLARMTVLCVPSLKDETFGQYNVEAMAMGVPVVAPRRGALDEVITTAGGGILVDPADRGAILGAVVRLFEDPALRRSLGEAGRARALERFSDDAMAAGMASVVGSAMARRRAAA